MKKLCLLCLLFLVMGQLKAQSGQISGFPLTVNPAFAGNMGVGRLSVNSFYNLLNKNRYKSNQGSTIAYDFFLKKLSTGIGISISENHKQNPAIYSPYTNDNFKASLAIAPKFSISGKYTFSPAVSLEMLNTDQNYRSDMDINGGGFYDFKLKKRIDNYFSITGGVLFNSKKLFTGLTYKKALNNRFGSDVKYQWNATFQIGYVFQRTDDSKFSFSPSAVFKLNNYTSFAYDEVNKVNHLRYSTAGLVVPDLLNLNFRYSKLIWGIGTDFMIGYQSANNNLRIMAISSNNSQEINLRYVFNKKNQGKSFIYK